ncbi:MAG: hypothetical protein ACE5IE_04060, partial [Dehalococcoidia bacterium]
ASRQGAGWRNPMGEQTREALKLQFDKRLRLEFQGARITSDAGLLGLSLGMGLFQRLGHMVNLHRKRRRR